MAETFLKPCSAGFLGCSPGSIGKYVLLPGDPGRVALIAEHLQNAVQVASSREYLTYTGTLLGEKVSVTSTGIGGPSTSIAVEELASLGARVLIRVGTSGLMQKYMDSTDLIVAWGAVRDEHTSQAYAPISYPAVADLQVTLALSAAAASFGLRHHIGMVQSKDSFYAEHEPHRMPVKYKLQQNWFAWQKAGVLCSEMEAATLFVQARMMNIKAGGLMVAGPTTQSLQDLIMTAVKAVEILIGQNKESGK